MTLREIRTLRFHATAFLAAAFILHSPPLSTITEDDP